MTASAAKSYREITQNIEMMHHQICLLGWGMWSKNKSIVTFHRISCCAMPVVLLGAGRPRFQDGIAVCKACSWSSCDFAAKNHRCLQRRLTSHRAAWRFSGSIHHRIKRAIEPPGLLPVPHEFGEFNHIESSLCMFVRFHPWALLWLFDFPAVVDHGSS